ncbi:MAG: HEPN domain-containing protein [Candidatus Hydrogenedentes bacterium]|nr:HEPN domain-containing protein [Candidatus Hydrogenedentota bacterium]
MVNVEKHIVYWLTGAERAWQDSEWLLTGKRYEFAAFAAHLALEKMLKAHVTKVTSDIPPRIHDLLYPAKLAAFTPSPEQTELLREFNEYQLEGRYPRIDRPPLDPLAIRENIRKGKEFYQWLKQQL